MIYWLCSYFSWKKKKKLPLSQKIEMSKHTCIFSQEKPWCKCKVVEMWNQAPALDIVEEQMQRAAGQQVTEHTEGREMNHVPKNSAVP